MKIIFKGITSFLPLANQKWKHCMLATLCIVCNLFQLQAADTTKDRLSVNFNNATPKEVVAFLESNTAYRFFYNTKALKNAKNTSIQLNNVTNERALLEVLRAMNVPYRVEKDQVILLKRREAAGVSEFIETPIDYSGTLAEARIEIKADRTITGRVTDETGAGLPGVNVIIKGTTQGATTDADGAYTLSISDGGDPILVFSFIGYAPKEVAIGAQSVIDVQMEVDITSLQEVIVVGYGTTTKEKNIASIATIDPKTVSNLGVVNLADGLAGRVQGLIVTSGGGGPGARSTISIRGGSTPLFVIDGIISDQLSFQTLNANDVENISFLKDGAATAIYGVAAGNGIVIVTTKRGDKDKEKVSINLSSTVSLSQSTLLPERVSAYELVQIINKTAADEGSAPVFTDDVVEKYRTNSDPLIYPNVNWRDLVLKRNAPEAIQNISINGGSKSTTYFASFGFVDQRSLYRFDTKNLKRYNYRLSVTHNIEKVGLKLGATVFGVTEKQVEPWNHFTTGLPHWNDSPLKQAFADLERTKYSANVDHGLVEIDPRGGYSRWEDFSLKSLVNAEWNLPWVKGLALKTNVQLDQLKFYSKGWRATAPQYQIGEDVPISQNPSELAQSTSTTQAYTYQFLVDFKRTIFTDHAVTLLLGYEQYYRLGESFSANTTGYQLAVPELFAGPVNNRQNDGSSGEEARRAHLGRLTYSFKDKYLFEVSFRRDASDLFPENNRVGFFPSYALGWVVTKERFLAFLDDKNILNHLKVKYSFGTVGQNAVGRYEYVPGYFIGGGYLVGGQAVGTITSPTRLVSPDIEWYTQETHNAGFEFATLNNKLSGNVEYFYNRTTGYLASPENERYSGTLGIELPLVKSNGAFRRAGFDFSLQYRSSIGKLGYTVGGNLVKFDQLWERNPYEGFNEIRNPYQRVTQQGGYATTGYHSLGLYQTTDELLNNPRRLSSILAPGDARYEDTNGDGKIDGADFRRIGKNGFPRANFGLNVDLTYGPWAFYLQLHGTSARTWNLADLNGLAGDIRYAYQAEDRWNPETGGKFPRILTQGQVNGNNNDRSSDAYFVNAGFLRIKAARLTYDLKHTLLKNARFLSDCRLGLSSTNLLTFSGLNKYNLDPEGNGYPVQRVYSLTLNVGL